MRNANYLQSWHLSFNAHRTVVQCEGSAFWFQSRTAVPGRPFHPGSRARSGPDPDPIVGAVQEVNWQTTRLMTLENDIIVIPNGMPAESAILNRSAPNLTCWF